MPLYEYRCTACGNEVEMLRKISDPPPGICPQCGKGTLQKKLTAAGFQLKGTGWYATDFRGTPKVAVPAATAEGGKDAAATTPAAAAPAEGVKPATPATPAPTATPAADA